MHADSCTPPKYFQISRQIIDLIQRGELPPGSMVPSENELIERHHISNTTARKVLMELEKGGWAPRVKGKGAYVRDFAIARPINRIFGFTRNMIEAGREPSTRLIGFHSREQDHTQIIDVIVEMEDSIYRGDMYRFAAKAVA